MYLLFPFYYPTKKVQSTFIVTISKQRTSQIIYTYYTDTDCYCIIYLWHNQATQEFSLGEGGGPIAPLTTPPLYPALRLTFSRVS